MATTSPGLVIDEYLIQLVDDRIADALARALLGRPREYTSLAPPHGMKRRAFVELCRDLAARGEPGVRRVGSVWVAEFDVFERAAVRRRRTAKPVAAAWTPESALRAAGARVPKK